jgi:hypothetical protein
MVVLRKSGLDLNFQFNQSVQDCYINVNHIIDFIYDYSVNGYIWNNVSRVVECVSKFNTATTSTFFPYICFGWSLDRIGLSLVSDQR